MPKFAVYFVPKAKSDFHRFGSSILGYDVRAGRPAPMLPQFKQLLPDFEESWVTRARPYGFHLTIGGAFDSDLTTLLRIKKEGDDILNCFGRQDAFILRRREDEPVGLWGAEKEVVALRYATMPMSI
jgi:hypothetical protein